ncbi:MAG TPA: YfhO family protein [Patescibacteria group bacterium]|nr:YfhO family protein [Patescibacteria group bacterium]
MSAETTRREPVAWAPAALIAAILALAFQGALAGRLFYLRDVSQNHMPVRRLVTDRLAAGSLPLWDPLHGGGTPLLANPDHLVLHPITLLFLALPFDVAFTASIVGQFALLALGGYLLARTLPVGRAPATLAALVLAVSGPAASLASQQNVLSAWAWVPLALWGWNRLPESGRRLDRVLAVLPAAVVLATGEAASALALVGFAVALAVARPASPDGEKMPARPRTVAVLLISVLALASLLAAVQTVPAAALLRLSPRGAGLPDGETLKWSLAPGRLAEMMLPGLLGDPTRLAPNAWWGRWLFEGGYPFLLSIYVGAIPCLLAAAALATGRQRRRAIALASAGGLFVALALGAHDPIFRLLHLWLPPLRQVRYPERFLLGAVLSVALLAALGLERLLRRRSGSRAAAGFGAAAVVAFLAATAIAAWPALVDGALGTLLRLPGAFIDSDMMAVVRGGALRSILWCLAETAALTVAALAIARGSRRTADLSAWALAAACGLSMAWAAAPARSTAAPGWIADPSPLREVVGHGDDAPRIHHRERPDDLSVWAKTDEQVWGFRFDRFSYSLMTGHPDRVPTMFDPATDRMDLAGSAALGARLPSLPIEDQVRVMRIAHAGFLLSWDAIDAPGLSPGPVLEGLSRPPLRVYEVRDVLPRARFVARARPPIDSADSVRSLCDRSFDPDQVVLIDGAVEGDDAGPAATAEARLLQDDPERVRISVEAPRHGWVVLADAFAPGWRATVDGLPAEIRRANLLFRAVEVPHGRHVIEMAYAPISLYAGAALTLCGFLILGAWVARPGSAGA